MNTPVNKFRERTLSLLFAVIVLLTITAAVWAFCLAANVVHKDLVDLAKVWIIATIALNAIFSIAVWIYGRAHISVTDVKKAWDQGSGAVLSILWDAMALIFALFTITVTPTLYFWLGIALVADVVIDGYMHYKR